MKQSPLISIQMITYNQADFISGSIQTALNQAYQNWELIIVDNHSTDETENKVRRFKDKRIRYFKNANYGILAINRNFALEKSRGEYIAILDSDDLWLPQKLAKQVQLVEQGFDFITSNGLQVDENNSVVRKSFLKPALVEQVKQVATPAQLLNLLLTNNFIASVSILARKEQMLQAGGFNEGREYIAAEDYCMWLNLAPLARFAYIDEKLFQYRLHSQNASGGGLRALQRFTRVVKLNRQLYSKSHYLMLLTKLRLKLVYHWFRGLAKGGKA